jgi:AcrR family transcriptional regulator
MNRAKQPSAALSQDPHPYRSRPDAVVDARMLRTREALRRALLSLLERKQFEHITIRDIAAEAGIGYATFFRHHASKSELLDEIAAEQIGQLMAMTLPLLDPRDTRVSCLALCQYIGRHRAIWSALLTGGAAATLRDEFIRVVQGRAGGMRGSGGTWLPLELGVFFGVAGTFEILTWWMRNPDQYSEEQIAEFLDSLVVTPTISRATLPPPAEGKAPKKK